MGREMLVVGDGLLGFYSWRINISSLNLTYYHYHGIVVSNSNHGLRFKSSKYGKKMH